MTETIMSDISRALPEIFLLVAAFSVLLLDLFLSKSMKIVTFLLAQLSLLTTAWLVYNRMGVESVATSATVNVETVQYALAFSNMYIKDALSDLLKIAMLLIGSAGFIYTRQYLRDRNMFSGEYYALVLFAILGMMIMVSANSMLLIYLGLELLSLSMYALVALQRNNGRASEAAMKYFVLGAIASGMLLYGMSIIYGLSGHLDLTGIAEYVKSSGMTKTGSFDLGLLLGLSFILVGLGFKLGVAPFHMWIPDVYDGAPTAVTQLIGTIPKLAAFGMVFRLLVEGLGDMQTSWQQILILLAVLSLAIGNIIAIAQTNLKRMLAYSTIAHMGFVAMGILAGTAMGYSATLFYTIVYALTALGGFAVIMMLSRKGYEADQLSDLKGLSQRHPWMAFMMMIILFSMAGVPPTVGFYAKMMVIQSVVDANLAWLAVYAVVLSVVGAYYYLRAIKIMYFDKADAEMTQAEAGHKIGLDNHILLSANGLSLVALGIMPGALMAMCVAVINITMK